MVKNLPTNARDIRDVVSISGSGRSPQEEQGNPFQYSCLENPMEREVWWATVHRVSKSQTQKNYTKKIFMTQIIMMV